jgi:hypothetical protein
MLHGDFVFGLRVTNFVHRGRIYFPYLKKILLIMNTITDEVIITGKFEMMQSFQLVAKWEVQYLLSRLLLLLRSTHA